MSKLCKFSFMRNFKEVADLLDPSDRGAFYIAVVDYTFDGTIPDFGDNKMLKLAFQGILPSLDNSKKNHSNYAKKTGSIEEDCECEEILENEVITNQEQKVITNRVDIEPLRNTSNSSSNSFSTSTSLIGRGGVGEEPKPEQPPNKSLAKRRDKPPTRHWPTDETCEALRLHWNETFEGTQVPKVSKLTPKRLAGIRQRVKDGFSQEQLFEAIDKARASDFCCSGDWSFGFDWVFCYKGNILKLLEGNYENKKQVSTASRILNAARQNPKMAIWFGGGKKEQNPLPSALTPSEARQKQVRPPDKPKLLSRRLPEEIP